MYVRQLTIEILYDGEWMAKTHHCLVNLSQKKRFSPS
jgi:hypothetical protein